MSRFLIFRGLIPAHVVLMAVIVLGATLVRFIGLDFGFPLLLKSDEILTVGAVRQMLEERTFEPSRFYFSWPNHTGIKATYLAVSFLVPLVWGMSAERALDEVPLEFFYLIARGVTATFGVIAVVLAYLIGARFSKSAGIIAAALFAFFPTYVEHSHYATSDVLLTTAVLLCVYAALRYLDNPSLVRLMGLSAASAFAIVTKYPGALTTVVIALVVTVAAWRKRRWNLFAGHAVASISAVAFFAFAISPALFANRDQVLIALTARSTDTHLGADGLDLVGRLGFYFASFVNDAGWFVVALAAIGGVSLVLSRDARGLPVLVGAIFWIALSFFGLHWTRWALPMYVTPLLLASLGVVALWSFLKNHRHRFLSHPWARRILVVVMTLSLLTQVVQSVGVVATLLPPDTREESGEDLERRGINETNSLYEGYTPFRTNEYQLVFQDFGVVGERLVPRDPTKEYLLLSSGMYGRFQAEEKYTEEQEFYRLVDHNFDLLVEYAPRSSGVNLPTWNLRLLEGIQKVVDVAQGAVGGPTIRVYAITSD